MAVNMSLRGHSWCGNFGFQPRFSVLGHGVRGWRGSSVVSLMSNHSSQAPAGSESALRKLMRRMREIVAETADGDTRFDKVVHQIAGFMVADACTIYLKRDDGSLELFATAGLNKAAVHLIRLKRGEGLVGRCAATEETINEADARSHPAFSYRPETGEDTYQSLLATPIRRSGQVLGVLVVQNRTPRKYPDEDVEVLETTGIVVAEMLAFRRVATAENIFISYRRSDTRHIAGRIYDRLGSEFPKTSVFFDVDKIPIGTDFRAFIETSVNSSFVMLSIIGSSWVNKNWTPSWVRFSTRAEDFVRIEIELALELGVPILPVLVDEACMPAREVLPKSIAAIGTINAASVRSGRDFHTDMDIVVNKIKSMKRRSFEKGSART